MKLTESKLKQIIREELNEYGQLQWDNYSTADEIPEIIERLDTFEEAIGKVLNEMTVISMDWDIRNRDWEKIEDHLEAAQQILKRNKEDFYREFE